MFWIALAILFVNGAPQGQKLIMGEDAVKCKEAREVELDKVKKANAVVWIGECEEVNPPEQKGPAFKKERDS